MRFPVALLLLFASLLPAAAPAQEALRPGERAMAVTLAAESLEVAAGGIVTLAFRMTPRPGWHGYWRNPGDAGAPDRVRWTLPKGVEADPLRYPAPSRLLVAGLMNYVYEGPYALLADLRVPAGLAPGTALPVRARLDYLVCTDKVCVPESASVGVDLVVGPGGSARDPAFDSYRASLPRPLGAPARFAGEGASLRIAIPLPAAIAPGDAYFYPLTDGALDYSAPQRIGRDGDALIVETAAESGVDAAERIEGVLVLGDGTALEVTAAPGGVPAARGSREDGGAPALPLILLGALLGGLLLNVMPCVFPILSLKALSLAKAGTDEAAARREGAAYAVGAVLACAALGAILLALRAGGAAAGWAFQLQDPRVIAFLFLLMTAIALNLAGMFALPGIGAGDRLARSGGAAGAFWTGALAALVATPCAGPFMGAAVGAAVGLPWLSAMAVFVGLGLGLALPFLLVGYIPALRRRLPRPGPWMARLRRILSVPMFLTAIALLWVLGRQAGVDAMTLALAAGLVLALALWWIGERAGGRPWLALLPALAAAAALLAVLPERGTAAAAGAAPATLDAQPFDEARLAALRAEKRPVFIYFTADWCLICKVNEQAVLAREEVAARFADAGVAVLVGDWTNGDAEIGRFLESQGRSGVPLYLYYPPGGGARLLPQLLTVGMITALPTDRGES